MNLNSAATPHGQREIRSCGTTRQAEMSNDKTGSIAPGRFGATQVMTHHFSTSTSGKVAGVGCSGGVHSSPSETHLKTTSRYRV